MISSKKLMKMVKKWQMMAINSRKRISFSRTFRGVGAEDYSTPSMVKGHVVMYTADERRFMIPLDCLNNDLFRELLKMAEEEYGLPSYGPIVLPCKSVLLEYAISLIGRNAAKDLENALLMTISSARCLTSSCFHQEQRNQPSLLCSY